MIASFKRFSSAAAGVLLASTAAQAGGFQLGQADVDILFEPGSFVSRSSVTYIVPRRGFETLNGVGGDFGTYSQNVVIPGHAIMFGGDRVACSGAYAKSFGATSDYGDLPGGSLPASFGNELLSRTTDLDFQTNEVSATCRLSHQLGASRMSLLGGLFAEDFDIELGSLTSENVTGAVAAANPLLAGAIAPGSGSPIAGTAFVSPIQVDVDADGRSKLGWRFGAAYEIPEIALRAQVVYRSKVEHDNIVGTAGIVGSGPSFALVPGAGSVSLQQFGAFLGSTAIGDQLEAALPGAGTPLPDGAASLNTITSPASLNVNLQTGIAQDTLLLGAFRWTDWSTLQEVVVSVGGVPGSITPFLWRDGYTASIGLGHAVNEHFALAASLGYDRGVSTGAELDATDAYTLSGGFALTQGPAVLQVGGLVGFLDSGTQSLERGALFDATVDRDMVYGGNVSFRLAF